MSSSTDSSAYLRRKGYMERFLTLYGRKPVLEALQQRNVRCARLHLASSNHPDTLLAQIVSLAEAASAEILYHDRQALARISRNGRQDQGVAADIHWQGYQGLDGFLADQQPGGPLIALDRIHNPQNLGMLIRTTAASGSGGLLLPRRDGCEISPLVIKASAGALFHARLLRCATLAEGLQACRAAGYEICILDGAAKQSLFDFRPQQPVVMVLGNESQGVSEQVRAIADRALAIPLANGVESLNVAVAGALVAFSQNLSTGAYSRNSSAT